MSERKSLEGWSRDVYPQQVLLLPVIKLISFQGEPGVTLVALQSYLKCFFSNDSWSLMQVKLRTVFISTYF